MFPALCRYRRYRNEIIWRVTMTGSAPGYTRKESISLLTIKARFLGTFPADRYSILYFEQSFLNNQLRIQAGQLLSHGAFFGNSYEELFINGILDEFILLSANLPYSPLFPMATPAVNFDLEPGKTFFLKAAIFSGSVEAQNVNRHSVTFPISKSSGAFLFDEVGFHLNDDNGGLPGTYSVAAFYHTGTRADVGYRPGGRPTSEHRICP
jgi:hypothetical protein